MTEIRQDMAAFAEAFPELAEVLRETIAGLPSLDPDSLHLLNGAASRLDLPQYAPMMDVAAARLDLPDYAPMVHDSARRLELPDYTSMLLDAAGKLELQIKFPCPKDRCHPSGNVVVLGGGELSAGHEASGEQDHR